MTGGLSVGIPVPEMDADTPPTAAFKLCVEDGYNFASISDIAKSGILKINQTSNVQPWYFFSASNLTVHLGMEHHVDDCIS
jgi:hypothetical protein